jgi:hypothetical protein
MKQIGQADFGSVEGIEEVMPCDRRRALERLLKPASVAQDYSFPQDVTLPTVRRPRRRTDGEMITEWMKTGYWPQRFY